MLCCPSCRTIKLPVIETRQGDEGIYRRRRCRRCDLNVTTLETIAPDVLAPPRPDRRRPNHKARPTMRDAAAKRDATIES